MVTQNENCSCQSCAQYQQRFLFSEIMPVAMMHLNHDAFKICYSTTFLLRYINTVRYILECTVEGASHPYN